MSENFKKLFKKKINKQARMIFSFQAAVFLAMLGYMIFKIIYLRSTTGLTDTIINELSGSFIESGIPRLSILTLLNLKSSKVRP